VYLVIVFLSIADPTYAYCYSSKLKRNLIIAQNLTRILEDEVYIEKPRGFEVHRRESHVCRLKKTLHGLKKEPRAWYSRIDGYLQSMGFTKSDADPNLYIL
jgi:hypothetical protein